MTLATQCQVSRSEPQRAQIQFKFDFLPHYEERLLHGQTLEKVSVVIGSLAVENSLLQDPQGMILFNQWRCRNGFASQHPFRPQPSFSGTDDASELVQLNHLSVPLPRCIELPFLQCTVSHAGLSLRTTSRGSDLVELEQSPPIQFHFASQVVPTISPVWETCFLWLSQCFLQVRFRKQTLFCPCAR